MATVDNRHRPDSSQAELAAAVRDIRYQAVIMLPGVVALLGFQLFGLAYGVFRLDPLQRVALGSGAVLTAGSVLLIASLLRRPRVVTTADRAQRAVQSMCWTLAGTTSAVLIGATITIVLAVAALSGSWTPAAVVGGLLVAITCWLCW